MDTATHIPTQKAYRADEFAKLPSAQLTQYRAELQCEVCKAPAYFARKRRSGTSYYFGARHVQGCKLAVGGGSDSETARLLEAARREAEDGIVRLVADRIRHDPQEDVEHDPTAEPHDGRARRYVRAEGSGRTLGTMQLNSLLRALNRDAAFAASDYRIQLENGAETTVRRYCIELGRVTERHRGRRRLYWGTTVFAGESADGRGGAWLFTPKGQPNLFLNADLLAYVLDRARVDELEELAGATFLTWSYLNVPKSNPDGRAYLSPREPAHLTLRLADDDPVA
ncbi:hypothetical protein [Leifsonia shinshuensis]